MNDEAKYETLARKNCSNSMTFYSSHYFPLAPIFLIQLFKYFR